MEFLKIFRIFFRGGFVNSSRDSFEHSTGDICRNFKNYIFWISCMNCYKNFFMNRFRNSLRDSSKNLFRSFSRVFWDSFKSSSGNSFHFFFKIFTQDFLSMIIWKIDPGFISKFLQWFLLKFLEGFQHIFFFKGFFF